MFIIIYTSKFINLISIIISIIIYIFTSFFINKVDLKINKVKFKANFVSNQISNHSNVFNSVNFIEGNLITSKENNTKISQEKNNEYEWYIEIEKISLKAPIQEGTTQNVMEDYVGHFQETSKDKGNIGLAAHNRGYKNNYFNKVKELKEGDKIKYKYKNIERIYEITKHEIIKNTDWTNLEDTEENIITLITCVENQPEYRRCVQGTEIK